MNEEILRGLKAAVRELVARYGDKVVALGLFGSLARGEATPKSDVDVIVIVRGWERSLERRYRIYEVLRKHTKRDVTIIDVSLRVAQELMKGRRSLTATMLNILYDCIIIYDPEEVLANMIEIVRDYVKREGLVRYKVGRCYGWMRKDGKPMLGVKTHDKLRS